MQEKNNLPAENQYCTGRLRHTICIQFQLHLSSSAFASLSLSLTHTHSAPSIKPLLPAPLSPENFHYIVTVLYP